MEKNCIPVGCGLDRAIILTPQVISISPGSCFIINVLCLWYTYVSKKKIKYRSRHVLPQVSQRAGQQLFLYNLYCV